jgi:2-amino-4-hydroxy-6-hydroxymethyldihydropteridine diphosphokinase
LGSNQDGRQGSPRRQIAWALRRLEERLGPLRTAPLYRTTPVSPLPQPDFLNTAAVGRAAVPPREILRLAKALEAEAGRDFDAPRDGPRPLDVDLLVWGDAVIETPDLVVPHPRLRRRAFVLVPLADVAPELPVPPDGTTVAELLRGLRQEAGGSLAAVEPLPAGTG